MGFAFKIARSAEEFQKIHALNYKTFVEEIPQHTQNEQEILVDHFHEENTYLICLKEGQVVGMLAVRGTRPFSLDKKLGAIEDYLSFVPEKPCEIRLLAVEKEHRHGRVFLGLAQLLARYCLKEQYDIAVISGTTRQEKLYSQMGFKPFAHMTGDGNALFQPMYLTKETFEASLAGRIKIEPISFLPGPVSIADNVVQALSKTAISHRSKDFMQTMEKVRTKLVKMTNAERVQILVGTGTLANDAVACQLGKIGGKGLILVTGEFGNRLVDHATRLGLSFAVIEQEWGQSIATNQIERELDEGQYAWLWTVHCETSTGLMFDLEQLTALCKKHDIKLCMDCISSLGVVPLNLKDVFMATGVSGKAIGSFTGLSFVFHQEEFHPSLSIPRYLDLGMYDSHDSVAYSHTSNLLGALLVALGKFKTNEPYEMIQANYQYVRDKIEKSGLPVLTSEDQSSPGIITVSLPWSLSSVEIGDDLYLQGYQLHYESRYLRQRNWLQIAFINSNPANSFIKMVDALQNQIQSNSNL